MEADAKSESNRRNWVAEKAQWQPLSLEAKRRKAFIPTKGFIPQGYVDSHNEKIEDKKNSIAKMQKQLHAAKVCDRPRFLLLASQNFLCTLPFLLLQAQKMHEERESQKLSKEEHNININTRVEHESVLAPYIAYVSKDKCGRSDVQE